MARPEVHRWNMAAAILIGLLLARAGEAGAGTSTATVDWTINSSVCVCGGSFACSDEPTGWDGGMRSFADPVPAGATVTGVSVVVFAVFGCEGAADLDVQLQGTTVEERTLLSNQCECNQCDPNTFSGTAVAGWPGYNYGGTNTLFLNLESGVICADRAEITLTWSDTCGNGTVEPYEACDDGNTTDGDGCSAACRVEPCYTCAGQPSTCSPLPDGTACDDGLFCNGTDTCSGATCSIHTGDPCSGGADCNDVCNETNDNCLAATGTPCMDDGNACTFDQCDGMGLCIHPDDDFAPCDDGVFCNGTDTCLGGTCTLHDGDPCVSSECSPTCDEMAGACDPEMAGTPCSDDGLVCTSDQCDGAGSCVHPPLPGGAPCPDDGNDCTNDECDGIGLCVHPVLPDGTMCDDSNACTQTDRCQAGHCIGSDPVVCAPIACRQTDTCDPSTGTCTSCPTGYTQGAGGCQKTYAIDESRLDNQPVFCDASGANRYTCSTPFGFHWTDGGDSRVGAVTRVDVQIEAGLDCSVSSHDVTLDGTSIGVYASTAAASCSCVPPLLPQLFTDADTSNYAKGGSNAVSITTTDCTGLSQDTTGRYALVTVTYEDLGAPIAIQSNCRQALTSKLRYENSVNDARDKVFWKWGQGAATTQAEFGDPTLSADYQFCVYAETGGSPVLLIGAEVPADASSWTAVRNVGYRYTDKLASQDGIRSILVRGGAAGRSKIILEGKGAALSDPALPLPPANGIRVQLTNDSSGVCWESELPVSAIGGGIHLRAR